MNAESPMPDEALIDLLQRLSMGLGLGFLVGVERGFRHRDAPEGTRAAGLRTHAIIGLLGGVVGALLPVIGQIGFAALTLAFAFALIAFKLRESAVDNDVSVTGTLAALLLYALGAYAMSGDLRVVAAVGVTLVVLLALKEALHTWLDKLTPQEMRSALLILAATAIVLPILPDGAVDPGGVLHPRELWLLTIFVAGASFAGYVAVRLLGPNVGVLAGAAAGALVSSTVVTAELGRRVRAAQTSAATAAAGAALAGAVSVTRIALFVAVAANAALPQVAPALAAGALAFVFCAWALVRLNAGQASGESPTALHNPLDIASVVRFALLLGAVTAIGRLSAGAFGEAGFLAFAAAGGFVDVDTVAMAVASLVRAGLAAGTAAHAILIAVLVNTLAKGLIGGIAGGWRFGGLYLAAAAAAALVGASVWRLSATIPWLPLG